MHSYLKRIDVYIDSNTFKSLKELPGNLSEKTRIALMDYLEKVKNTNATSSLSGKGAEKHEEHDSNTK